MTGIVSIIVRLLRAFAQAYERRWAFLALSFAFFMSFVTVLAHYDLLPNAPRAAAEPGVANERSATAAATPTIVANLVEEPMKIEIPKIGTSAVIANPTTTDITALDALLHNGAVRYPTSAKLGEKGNVVLFGHSSYLPVVLNPNYKTFNGIQKLAAGDTITVYSSGMAYTYAVQSVAKESAASDAGIDLAVSGRVLTLATCNSFATKTDRFIVTANFVESHAISTGT